MLVLGVSQFHLVPRGRIADGGEQYGLKVMQAEMLNRLNVSLGLHLLDRQTV